ncbi:MAG: ribbon-helix-helix protein, CopG family [Nitrospinae bacterium]|nr:ribbon-helix-helix protein, CopG family [Nitrospinota bacterium]
MTLSVRLNQKTEHKLENLSKQTGRTKSWYIRHALEQYLDEWEDYQIALTRLENETGEIGIAEVRKRLGLED